jgi:hypothetical protein
VVSKRAVGVQSTVQCKIHPYDANLSMFMWHVANVWVQTFGRTLVPGWSCTWYGTRTIDDDVAARDSAISYYVSYECYCMNCIELEEGAYFSVENLNKDLVLYV